jgi:threonine aldolase
MVSFESDYNNGMLPEILERLAATNDEKCSGYGYDPYSESAKAKIISAIGKEDAEVFFLVGGTQTNATVIDSLLLPCEGVICVETAHIAVHESGAVEASGHKVITLPTSDSKMDVASLKAYMNQFLADETYPHMVQPGMVYITMPTEHGMVYTRDELALLYDTCRHYNLKLYVDGARLGYGLTSNACDYDLKFLAAHCDAFYIGGTKVGAMMGEAVVFSNIPAPKYFFTTVKRHGALLAKGRMIGIQFDTLFTDGLYFRISRHAIDMAVRLKEIFASSGIPLAVDSPTNQQFAILNRNQYNFLSNRIKFEIWEPSETDEIVCRFVTSWATTDNDIIALSSALDALPK